MTAALQRQEPGDPRAKAIEAMARAMYAVMRRRLAKWDIPTWEEQSAARHEAYREDARAALAALEQEGLVLTDTREAERLREMEVHLWATVPHIHWQGGTRGTHNCDFKDCNIAPCPQLREALSTVPVEEDT